MKAETIRRLPLFAALPNQELKTLAETLQKHDLRPGEIFMVEGTASESFYIILEGEVEIVKSLGTPDERVIAVRGRDSMLGEMSMFSQDGTHTASVRTRTPVQLLVMTLDQFDTLLHSHPALAYDMLRLLSRRLEESENLTIIDLREKNRQLTKAYRELKAAQAAMIEKERLERELEIAAGIQRGILPEELPAQPAFDFGALMIPARMVGGDFYDFIPLDQHRMGIVVGDVCDKGMPAALFMALTYSSVRSESRHYDSPADVLRVVNQHLLQLNRSGMFVTLLYGVLNLENCQFAYARAGHPQPLVLDQLHRPLNTTLGLGQPIGLFDSPALDEQTITIPPGGTMLVYSDGLSETIEASGNAPSLAELCNTVMDGGLLNAQELCDRLWRTVGGESGESLIKDDFTVVALRSLTF